MKGPELSDDSVAAVIARFLKARGVDRVFGLCGGHIMPIWMRLEVEGIPIVDVRDERAAVHMAHAHAELTGQVGVALITAGPGVTNGLTGIANAHVARVPLLVLSGVVPGPQENRGALQDIAHTEIVRPLTRYARTVRESALVPVELDAALSRAFGEGGEPGPVYLDFPVDTLRAAVPAVMQMAEHLGARSRPRLLPDPATIAAAVDVLWSARRPVFITGRGARNAGPVLLDLIERLGALHLDTGESRGLVPDSHPSSVAAMRAKVMAEADVVVTVGRRLDFQLAYGSPAVFGEARFVRIADNWADLRDNRRGNPEILATPADALDAIIRSADGRSPATDVEWVGRMQAGHRERAERQSAMLDGAPDGSDGRMHPLRLLGAVRNMLAPDAVVVADGGDFLSFARTALPAASWLDPGALGCIGVGTCFGIAAGLACPGRQVVVVTGDGAFGFNAIEIDTAVRHRVPVLIVVANNGSWAIEVRDQQTTYGKIVGTRLRYSDYAAAARALGMYAERVECADALAQALARASANLPALVDVVVTPEAESTDSKSGLAWVPDLQPLAGWDRAEQRWRSG